MHRFTWILTRLGYPPGRMVEVYGREEERPQVQRTGEFQRKHQTRLWEAESYTDERIEYGAKYHGTCMGSPHVPGCAWDERTDAHPRLQIAHQPLPAPRGSC